MTQHHDGMTLQDVAFMHLIGANIGKQSADGRMWSAGKRQSQRETEDPAHESPQLSLNG